MRRLTCSRLDLASHCLYWLREDVAHENIPSEARELGTAFHVLAAARINGATLPDGDASDAALVLRDEAIISGGCDPASGKRAEVAYAFDPATGTARELGVNIGRDYDATGARPGEICGSADVVIRPPLVQCEVPALPEVRDWKTGEDCGAPAASTQLRALASMAALAHGWTSPVEVAYDYVSPDGVRSSTAILDSFSLREVIPLELTVLADAVAKDGPASQPEPGPWCEANDYCPAFHHCPAQRARQVAAAPAHVRHLPVLQDATAAIESPTTAAAIIASLNALEGLVKVWWSKLDAYVDANGPIDVGGGKAYRAWPVDRESIVVDENAELALREHFGDAYKSLIDRSVAKSDIEKEAKRITARGKGAEKMRAVMSSLANAGCTRVKRTISHGIK